ncbi:MAG: hypothetical protein M1832_001206, partial [Thelocarpon impressellum]
MASPRALGGAAVLAVFLCCASARAGHPLGIEWDPAPPPEKGAPLSFHASRDKGLLPAQIGAIVGAYVLSLIVIGLALLFVGRRLRASAESSRRTLDVEMVKPANPAPPLDSKKLAYPKSPPPTYVSPGTTSPAPNFSWPSPKQDAFDERVVEDDKARAEAEMERLYAAVLQQDAVRSAKSSVAGSPRVGQHSPSASEHGAGPAVRSPQTLLNATRASGGSHASRGQPAPPPTSPRSERHVSRASSILSNVSGRSKRKTVRGLQISSPIQTPTHSLHSRAASTDEPKSPLLSPGPALPPSPPLPPPPPVPSQVGPAASIDGELHAFHAHRTQNNGSAGTARPSPKPLPFRSGDAPRHGEAAGLAPAATRVTVL